MNPFRDQYAHRDNQQDDDGHPLAMLPALVAKEDPIRRWNPQRCKPKMDLDLAENHAKDLL